MFFTVENLLGSRELECVGPLLRQAQFVDGAVTAQGGSKRNQEMAVSQSYAELIEILNRALEISDKINMRIFPRYRTNPIINRYDTGMFYAEHIDSPIQGGTTQVGRAPGRFGQSFVRTDYSMTLFLSDPSTYEGGELCLRIAEELRTVKLRAGSAVCYATGIPHSVRPVTRGTRIAAIYWFQSYIREPQLRSALWDQRCLEHELNRAGQSELAGKAATIRSNLIRYLAEI
jgi:PKHD-type hydroxylase